MSTKLSRTTIATMKADLTRALNAVAKKHGLTVQLSGGIFSDTCYQPNVKFKPREDKRNDNETRTI